jgi:nicotinate-nucleotide pyrophosphorylase (carboxylating)
MLAFPAYGDVRPLIDLARREDLGEALDDVTGRLLVPEDRIGVGTLFQKEPGVVCGLGIVEMVCRTYDERLRVEPIPGLHLHVIEGRFSNQRLTPLLRIRGPMRSMLSAERVILNFLQYMSGIATLTHRFVKRVEGTSARIFDTRKTIPGYRALAKYAVRAGGGQNHRQGLYDGLLVKDNHMAGVPVRQLAGFLEQAVRSSRSEAPGRLIEVEVTSLEQLGQVLRVDGIDVVLLDNMDCPRMSEAVRMRDAAGKRGILALEASGGVTLETVRTVAETGVDRIAVGAITHSAPALDISLEVEDQ